MPGDPNLTYICALCGGPITEGIPHYCSGTLAPNQPATNWVPPPGWLCRQCWQWVHPGTVHYCPPKPASPPVVSQASPAAQPDYSVLLAQIATGIERAARALELIAGSAPSR